MPEVVCHDLMALKTPGIFCESASLAKACKPTKLLQELVAKHFLAMMMFQSPLVWKQSYHQLVLATQVTMFFLSMVSD